MTTYIETQNELLANETLDWEISGLLPELAGLEYGSPEEIEALDGILAIFEKENDVFLDPLSLVRWYDIARDYYNTSI